MSKQKNKEKKAKKKKFFLYKLVFFVLTFPLFFGILNFAANIYFLNRSLPNIFVAGVNMGNWKPHQIENKITEIVARPLVIKLKINDDEFEIHPESINLTYSVDKTTNSVFTLGKSSYLANLITIPLNILPSKNISLSYAFDENKLDEFVDILANENTSPPISYSVKITRSGVEVDSGKIGKVVDKDAIKKELLNLFSTHSSGVVTPEVREINETLTSKETGEIQMRAENLVGKDVDLNYEYKTVTLTDEDLVGFLAKDDGFKKEAITAFIEESVIPKIERPTQNAYFVYKDERVEEFAPAKNGVVVDKEVLAEKIIFEARNLIADNSKTAVIEIPVLTQKPDTELDDVNNLGINQLIGRGVSTFKTSITSRIYNIGHASKKFNNILVAPGETFSFVNILGDVSALTGYKQAYIIKDGRTVLGDGGGVCQVSTTLFRAVLNAGLPVVERRAHSYRVGYYEQNYQPGVDATVYYPSTDFKFKNDTPAYILIQSIFDPDTYTLVFEIYGTNDGRVATVGKSTINSVTPPPEDLYVDDPTLPIGTVKQIDHKAWGAKVSFKYTVERDGETLIDKTFVSNYQPWQAVFLRGISTN